MQSNELKGKIVAAGYSQRSLAMAMRQAGVSISKNTLSKKVNGRTAFNTDEVVCICDLLKSTILKRKRFFFCSDRPRSRTVCGILSHRIVLLDSSTIIKH